MQSTHTRSFPPGSWLLRIPLLAGASTGLPAALLAQMDEGTITGTVQDNTCAVVPGAPVSLTSVDTGLVLTTTTDGSGVYTFSPVKTGNYKLSATAAGFSTTVQDSVHLSIQHWLQWRPDHERATSSPTHRMHASSSLR